MSSLSGDKPVTTSLSYKEHRISLLLQNSQKKRLTYDDYKGKHSINMGHAFGKNDDSINKKYRQMLDKERELKLSKGINNKHLKKKLKKKDKKKLKKSKKDKKRKDKESYKSSKKKHKKVY